MPTLQFHSTNRQAPRVDLREALLQGQAPDRGLYLPDSIPTLTPDEIAAFARLDYAGIAFEVLRRFTAGILDDATLAGLCRDAYNYDVPLDEVEGRIFILRLDRGPTASFKDFAARMMARLIGRFVREDRRRLTILTATSGDTGSAVASAFHGIEGIRVILLFPIGEVSDRQRKQMTTLGGNIAVLAIDGKFDDCQAMVKRAFADPDLAHLSLSSANSINIGRLLPQSVYYFYAASRVARAGEPLVVAVPSGNFGNMMGCVLARKMGLNVKHLVVPVNENDAFPQFLATGQYRKIDPSRACLSNAMNVGHPSNLARLVELYGGWLDEQGTLHQPPDLESMRREIFSTAVTDQQTRDTIRETWEKYKILLEPHGAVAWRGFRDYLEVQPLGDIPAVVVETAHPAKFPEEIEKLLGFTPEVPESLAKLEDLEEKFETMGAEYPELKNFLQSYYS